jgi:hypothetical protein
MQKFLIPKKGLIVRHPKTMNIMPSEGMLCDWTGPNGRYWRRRVNCGDCIIKEETVVKRKVKE